VTGVNEEERTRVCVCVCERERERTVMLAAMAVVNAAGETVGGYGEGKRERAS
jgi:glycerol-3-phosphate dehydrogenase